MTADWKISLLCHVLMLYEFHVTLCCAAEHHEAFKLQAM